MNSTLHRIDAKFPELFGTPNIQLPIIILDLVEEKVRNRLLYSFVVLLMYLTLLLVISIVFFDETNYPTDIKLIT